MKLIAAAVLIAIGFACLAVIMDEIGYWRGK